MIDDIFDALELDEAPVLAHSLGGMFALWHAAAGSHRIYRRLLGQGLGAAEVAAAPDSLIDALRLSARRPGNARTVASLMHAIDHFRRPRTESVLTIPELAAIAIPTIFIWGTDAPYLSADRARPSIDQIPHAALHVVSGGHGPWLVDTKGNADLIHTHLSGATITTR